MNGKIENLSLYFHKINFGLNDSVKKVLKSVNDYLLYNDNGEIIKPCDCFYLCGRIQFLLTINN